MTTAELDAKIEEYDARLEQRARERKIAAAAAAGEAHRAAAAVQPTVGPPLRTLTKADLATFTAMVEEAARTTAATIARAPRRRESALARDPVFYSAIGKTSTQAAPVIPTPAWTPAAIGKDLPITPTRRPNVIERSPGVFACPRR